MVKDSVEIFSTYKDLSGTSKDDTKTQRTSENNLSKVECIKGGLF